MYKAREHHNYQKLCKHSNDGEAPKSEQVLKRSPYDQIKSKVMESDSEAYNNVLQLAKKQQRKPRNK